MRVLIVEDEIYARQSLVKHVRENTEAKISLEIFEAANGRDGIAVFREKNPEIVILDIKMPFLDGLSMLKLIMEEQPSTKVLMVSGYANFHYSQEAINCGAAGYLLKPVQDEEFKTLYRKIIEENSAQHKSRETLRILKEEDALSRSIYQHMVSDIPFEEGITDEVFDAIFDRYLCVVFFFPQKEFHDMVAVVRDIESIMETSSAIAFKIVTLTKQRLGIIIREHANATSILKAAQRRIFGNGFLSFAGVSLPLHGSSALKRGYQQAMTAVKSKLLYDERMLCYDRLILPAKGGELSDSDYDVLRLLLERGDSLNARATVSALLERLLESKTCNVIELEQFLQRLSGLLTQAAEMSGSIPNTDEKLYSFEFDLLFFPDKEALIFAVKHAVVELCEFTAKINLQDKDKIMNTVSRYIHENYNKEISLRYLAEKVLFLNHTYLSHLIREKTGKSYSDYLREIRIEKAQELLKNSSLTITDIASMCGYNDASQFIQIFKKEVGTTPKKVRDAERTENR